MHKLVAWLIGCFAAVSLSLVAQEPAKPASGHQAATNKAMSSDAKIKLALSAGPSDLTKDAAVVEPGADGKMMQLRAGTNGWVCMAHPEVMSLDKEWQGWVDAWTNKKDPQIKSVGIAYMLKGDKGTSNTDPFATAPTATNQWVVSPAHLMVLTPDTNQLAALPTDPHNGGPWVMWKGTKYAHIMVPTVPMPAKAAERKSRIRRTRSDAQIPFTAQCALLSCLFTVTHLAEDRRRGGGPDEGFGVTVVMRDVLLNGTNQVGKAPKCAATNPLACDVGKPAFHQIKPRRQELGVSLAGRAPREESPVQNVQRGKQVRRAVPNVLVSTAPIGAAPP